MVNNINHVAFQLVTITIAVFDGIINVGLCTFDWKKMKGFLIS